MTRKLLAAVAAVTALAVPATAYAQGGGNLASGSVGTVQVGDTTVDPTATATVEDTAAAAVAAPTEIAGDGGNEAADAVGSVQVGGGNRVRSSAATAQVSGTTTRPAARATVAETTVDAAVPAAIAGGSNTADDSLVTVQVGGGGAASGDTATVRVAETDAGAEATVATPGGDAVTVDVDLLDAGDGAVDVDPGNLAAGRPPELNPALLADPSGRLVLDLDEEPVAIDFDDGLDLGEPQGTNDDSLLNIQRSPIEAAPSLVVRSDALDTTVTVGGTNTVGGGGPNSATDSPGTAQIAGGNDADGSLGTVQSGQVSLAPAATADTPLLGAFALGLDGGIGGEGGNSASDSTGTVQLGGGNEADGSTGSVQSGPVMVGPTASADDTPTGTGLELGGTTGIDDTGSNDATDSTGTAQVGGGNTADGSTGTAQTGAVTADPGTEGDGPAGGTVDGGTTIGGDGSNTATDSIGTGQIGGGNTATDSTGTIQIGSSNSTGPTTPPGGETPTGGPLTEALPVPDTNVPGATPPAATTPEQPRRRGTKGASKRKATPADLPTILLTDRGDLRRVGSPATTLPFTGLALWLAALLALGLIATGTGIRKLAKAA